MSRRQRGVSLRWCRAVSPLYVDVAGYRRLSSVIAWPRGWISGRAKSSLSLGDLHSVKCTGVRPMTIRHLHVEW